MTARASLLRASAIGLAATWKVRTRGDRHLEGLKRSGRPFLYALWHCQILPLLWYHRGTRASLVVSSHHDGGVLADAASSWGFGLIRGSSTRGGTHALRGILRALDEGTDVAITPDGPRGPPRQVKPGIVRAAQLAGVAILPVRAEVSRAWRTRSWDGFIVPRMFASIDVVYAPPLFVKRGDAQLVVRTLQLALDGAGVEVC